MEKGWAGGVVERGRASARHAKQGITSNNFVHFYNSFIRIHFLKMMFFYDGVFRCVDALIYAINVQTRIILYTKGKQKKYRNKHTFCFER